MNVIDTNQPLSTVINRGGDCYKQQIAFEFLAVKPQTSLLKQKSP